VAIEISDWLGASIPKVWFGNGLKIDTGAIRVMRGIKKYIGKEMSACELNTPMFDTLVQGMLDVVKIMKVCISEQIVHMSCRKPFRLVNESGLIRMILL